MPTFTLTHVDDEALLANLAALVSRDRQTTAMLLAHIAEVDARGLYLPAACPSMHVYCTRVLHLAEDAAYKRIRAARAGRRFPQILDAIADGRLHLSGVVLLAPHLRDENVDGLLAEATHRSKLEIEMLVARLAPRPDVQEAIAPAVPPAEPLCTDPRAPGPVALPPPEPPRVKPLAPERFALQLTIGQETRDKLERARALMRHQHPSGELAAVIDRALDALLVELERTKFGATSRPRATRAPAESVDPRYVTSEVRRAVHARDGEQCTFVGENGERCGERGFLEIDHRIPVARGGQPTVENLRLLCRAHNQYEAERRLGAETVRTGRDRRRSRAASAEERAAATAPVNRTGAAAAPANAFVGDDLALALRGLGFKAEETRRALAAIEPETAPGATFEDRLRAALARLTRSSVYRCGDGPMDAVVAGWSTGSGPTSWVAGWSTGRAAQQPAGAHVGA